MSKNTETVRQPDNLNRAQRIVADAYADGEFSHITIADQADDVGDTLFSFIIRELDDVEDLDEAARRAETAYEQLGELVDTLQAIADAGDEE